MELANCMVAIGGDKGNTVPRYKVTPAEILTLMAIHGGDSVFDVEPLAKGENRSSREEIARLREVYATAKGHDDELVVATLFPGAGARAPETLEDLGLDESLFKPVVRMTKAEAPAKSKRKGATKAEADPEPEPEPEPEEAEEDDGGDVSEGTDPFN